MPEIIIIIIIFLERCTGGQKANNLWPRVKPFSCQKINVILKDTLKDIHIYVIILILFCKCCKIYDKGIIYYIDHASEKLPQKHQQTRTL